MMAGIQADADQTDVTQVGTVDTRVDTVETDVPARLDRLPAASAATGTSRADIRISRINRPVRTAAEQSRTLRRVTTAPPCSQLNECREGRVAQCRPGRYMRSGDVKGETR